MEKKLLIVDCDAGIDDALALVILTAAHKVNRIKLLAITCVNGNTVIDNVVNNVFRTLEACGTEDVSVTDSNSPQECDARFSPVICLHRRSRSTEAPAPNF